MLELLADVAQSVEQPQVPPQTLQQAIAQALGPITTAVNGLVDTVNGLGQRISTLNANNRHLLRNSMVSVRWW